MVLRKQNILHKYGVGLEKGQDIKKWEAENEGKRIYIYQKRKEKGKKNENCVMNGKGENGYGSNASAKGKKMLAVKIAVMKKVK